MSRFWTVIFLCFAFSICNTNFSEAKHQKKKLTPAVVVGTVYCDTCFKHDLPKASHFIPGASVAVECRDTVTTSSTPTFRQEAKTDSNGQFKIKLPFRISKHVRKIENCSVKLVRSNQPFCSIAATAESSSLRLKSRKQGVHVFSAGFFSFKPLNQPYVCDQKPSTDKKPNFFMDSKEFSPVITNPNDPTFAPPIQDPPSGNLNLPLIGHYLPPLPQLPNLPPLPQLPRLPSLPGIPLLPPKQKAQNTNEVTDKKVVTEDTNRPMDFPFPPNPFNPVPNPFQPPPSLFPPNPFQPPPSVIPPLFPSPPPSLFPPLLPTPSPPPFFNLPPVPGLFPSPSPPPPVLPIRFPPFPFQPVPGFPGVPPANKEISSETKTSSSP